MDLKQLFIDRFGGNIEAIRTFHAPGRVNLIGEHIDYNGGYVLPCALDMGTYALIRQRDDDTMRFASTNFELEIQISLGKIEFDQAHDWANYPKGIIRCMQDDGHPTGKISGFDILFSGDIPSGAGLSSSASIELVTAAALNTVFDLGYSMIQLIQLAQRAENQFCGVNCGIMDQFVVGLGQKDKAIFLHCDSLKYEYVHADFGDYQIVIMNTNKRRQLNESKYNERRAECDEAADLLGVALLGTLNAADEPWEKLQDSNLRKRARHVVLENQRVIDAVKSLNAGDLAAFGELMVLSHHSLRDDYEVSCVELDTLVAAAMKQDVCIGARMTGAGFGGCAIALVKASEIPQFIASVTDAYKDAIGYAPTMYVQKIGDGARAL